MALREVSFNELQELVSDVEETRAMKKVQKTVANLYGPNARYVEIDADGEYNDEGGTDYYVRHLEVYDDKEEPMEYDFTTRFWKKAIKENKWNAEELKEDNSDVEDIVGDTISNLSDDSIDYGTRYDLKKGFDSMPKIFIEE